jgi:hypothetical protein
MRIHKCAKAVMALISLCLLGTIDSGSAHGAGGGGAGSSTSGASSSGSGGPGSCTQFRRDTGNGNLKGVKAIARLWHLWTKGPDTPLIPAVARVTPMVLKRVAKKAPANTTDPRLTALPLPAAPVAKITKMAAPAPTPAAEGAEIQIFWWPDPDVIGTNLSVTK